MTFLKKLFLFLILVSLSATGVMYLLEPIESLEDNLNVYNNRLVCKKEIKSIILNNFDEGQSFIKYNPLAFGEIIKEHPLIKDVKVRTNLLTKEKFHILITEETPWAIFRNKIFNNKFKIIKDFDSPEDQVSFDSVDDLYSAILNMESNILQIQSNDKLGIKKLKKLKKITDQINERLNMIEKSKILKIDIIDDELTLISSELKLIFGLYQKRVQKKIKKLDHMLDKVKNNISEIEYIDLSLDTDEAIIGKKL